MYDARTREMYAAMFKTAEAVVMEKLASELAHVLSTHTQVAAELQTETK